MSSKGLQWFIMFQQTYADKYGLNKLNILFFLYPGDTRKTKQEVRRNILNNFMNYQSANIFYFSLPTSTCVTATSSSSPWSCNFNHGAMWICSLVYFMAVLAKVWGWDCSDLDLHLPIISKHIAMWLFFHCTLNCNLLTIKKWLEINSLYPSQHFTIKRE